MVEPITMNNFVIHVNIMYILFKNKSQKITKLADSNQKVAAIDQYVKRKVEVFVYGQ